MLREKEGSRIGHSLDLNSEVEGEIDDDMQVIGLSDKE